VWCEYLRSSGFNNLVFTGILLVGLIVRLLVAPFSSGSDIVQFAGFARTIQRHGLCFYEYAAKFYTEKWPYNWPYVYGPVLAYILGLLSQFVSPDYTIYPGRYPHVYISASWVFAVKLVYIVFDTVAALLVYITTRRPLLVALYYLNPAVIYTSSIYGMFDQIPLTLLLLSLILIEKKPVIAGGLLAASLLTKQTMLFPIIGVLLVLLVHYRKLLLKVLVGLIIGVFIVLSLIIVYCPSSILRLSNTLRDTSYMWRPSYVSPFMYSFNGLTSILTLIHRKLGIETLWFIQHWYIYTLVLTPLLVLYTLRERDLYLNTALYYLLFTATYWGINYQYLTPLIGLLAVSLARESRDRVRVLYTVIILYTAVWCFIFPVRWWFYAHIEHPNTTLIELVNSLSLNIYIDEYYVYYSLVLTILEYITLLVATLTPLREVRVQVKRAVKVINYIVKRAVSGALKFFKLFI